MIYIKDYRSLNSLVNNLSSRPDITPQLRELIGKTITVYTDSGGVSGCGFTGVLTEVLSGSIKLLTGFPPGTFDGKGHGRMRMSGCPCSYTVIAIGHIAAIAYNDV